jgi:hypothetical protein
MKCSRCQRELDTDGVVVTLVSHGATYTATLHQDCAAELIGQGNYRKLRTMAFMSGWKQLGLPLLRES